MKSFYYGKYPAFNLMLNTELKELPKLPTDDYRFDYAWNYASWILSDGKILYNGQTTKDPDSEEIQNIISFLTGKDPTINGVFSISAYSEDELASEYGGASNYFVSKGTIQDFDFNLMFELAKNSIK